MKRRDKINLKELNEKALQDHISGLRKKIQELRFRQVLGYLESPISKRISRRELARTLTHINSLRKV